MIEHARAVVPVAALLPGVAALVPVLEVEALFPWGSTLVHVDAPFGAAAGLVPGQVRAAVGAIALAPGAPRRAVMLRNTGPRDVWISSHFPLDQVNPAVEIRFDDDSEPGPVPPSAGCRLDLPAGEALLLRPGERSALLAVIRTIQ